MRAILVALAGLVLITSCATNQAAPPRTPATERPSRAAPDELADGRPVPPLPAELEGVPGGPLVMAMALDGSDPLISMCRDEQERVSSPASFDGRFAGGYLGPHGAGIQFEMVDDEIYGRALNACDIVWDEGEPLCCGGALHPWRDDEGLREAGGAYGISSSSSEIGFLSIPVSDEVAWVLVPHDGYSVAYPVGDHPVRISAPVTAETGTGTAEPFRITVHMLGADGRVLGQEEVTGVVAG